jgi:hypothetical protein
MHIWRQRTRRDRGKALLIGVDGWGCHKDDKSNVAGDALLQYEEEHKHVTFFKESVRVKMHQYLNTIQGMNELKALSKILKENKVEIDKKSAIYSIFRYSHIIVITWKMFAVIMWLPCRAGNMTLTVLIQSSGMSFRCF